MIGRLDLEPVRGLLFDIDGTLAETDDLYVEKLARRLEPLSFILPKRDPNYTARRIIMAVESPANYAYTLADSIHLDELAAELARMLRLSHHKDRPGPPPARMIAGTRVLIERASTRYELGIVTARGDALAMHFLQGHQLDSYFRIVVGARSIRRIKPHPAPIRRAAKELGLQPGECVMVGDTTVDILAGARAGAQTVGVLCGFGEQAELERAGASLILESTADLLDILAL